MKQLFNRMDKILFFSALGLFIFGAIMILSASSMESFARHGNSSYTFFIRQVAFLIMGAIGTVIILVMPIKQITRLAPIIIIITIGLLLGVHLYGTAVNAAGRWLPTGIAGFNIQPSEFAKPAIIVFLAWFFSKNKDKMNNLNTIFIAMIPVAIICISILLEPDLGTAIIITVTSLLMFYAVPAAKKTKKLVSLMLAGGAVIVLGLTFIFGTQILESHQVSRLEFMRPCDRYFERTGYQVCNGYIAINSGGLIGQGFGNSTQKKLYLPEAYTDFIFPVIIEELGFLSAVAIIFLYALIIARIFIISKKSITLEGSYIAYGVAVYIFCHIFINIGGFSGLIPLSGVPLPFLSYGGSYTLALFASLALVQRVAIEGSQSKKLARKTKT